MLKIVDVKLDSSLTEQFVKNVHLDVLPVKVLSIIVWLKILTMMFVLFNVYHVEMDLKIVSNVKLVLKELWNLPNVDVKKVLILILPILVLTTVWNVVLNVNLVIKELFVKNVNPLQCILHTVILKKLISQFNQMVKLLL